MTAQDAFAIAFDEFVPQEAWAMDRINGPSTNQNRTVGKKGSKKPSNGGGMGKMGGGMGRMGGGMGDMGGTGAMPKKEQSLAEHMAQYHKDGFDPRVNKCKLFDALKKNFERQGLSPEEAEQKALAAHNASGYRGVANQQTQPGGTPPQAIDETQARQLAEQMYQQFMQKPSVFAIEAMARQAVLIQPSITMQDANGDDVTIEDTFQLACMMFLQDQKENSGDEAIENAAVKAQAQLAEITSGENDGEVIQASSGDGNGDGLTPIKPPSSPSKYYQQKINQAQEKLASAKTDEERAEAQAEIDDATKELEIIKKDEEQFNQTRILSSSSGKTSRPLTAEEEQIIAENPDKEKTLREILDIEERVADNPEMKEGELGDLRNQREQKRIMFYGRDVGSGETTNNGSQRTTAKSSDYLGALDRLHDAEAAHDRTRDLDHGDENKIAAQKALEEARAAVAKFEQSDTDIVDDEGKVIDTGSDRRKWAERERVIRNAGGNDGNESSGDTQPSDQPSDTPSDKPSDQPSDQPSDTPSDQPNTPPKNPPKTTEYTPPDEQFRTKDGKYKINGIVYNDISGQGFLHSLYSSFLAGLRGEGIITGWDKISGKWDQMKRSANGENVRSGITDSLLSTSIGDYVDREDLSDDARMEIGIINDMYSQAKTPKQKMSAVKEFQKWKEKYADELGDEKETEGWDFSDIAQKKPDWKVPPTSILPEVPADERDTSFMEEKKQQILDHLNNEAGVPIEIVDSVNGSGVVQFKIKRQLKGTDKELREALKAMEPDIGVKISYNADTTSGAERMGTISINNPKVKDASLRRLLEDEEGRKTAEKMEAPLLLGETADGKAIWEDASEHGFLGGDSGAGKSERIIGMVSGACAIKPPSELQFVINAHANSADYEDFESDPHIGAIGKSYDEVARNLVSANAEWKRRQKLFAQMGFRNLKDYNKAMKAAGTPEKVLPQIVVITDEVTNLLAERPKLADEIRGIVTNGRKFGVCHIGATQDMKATNMPTDIKGRLRMGVQSTKKEAPRAIFDVHTEELGKINAKGDMMYRDRNGNVVRLRGTFVDPEARRRLVAYNSGEMPKSDEAPPESVGDKSTESTKLPQEHLEKINEAMKNRQPISMEAEEGFEDAFKSAFPEDWEITEEETDGKKYWRASPPKPNKGDSTESTEEPEKKIAKLDDLDQSFNPNNVDSMMAYRDRIMDAIKQLSNITVKGKKGNDALKKKLAPFKEELEYIEGEIKENYPDALIEKGDEIGDDASEEENKESDTSETPTNTPTLESKQQIDFINGRFERKRKELEKARDAEPNDRKAAKINNELIALQKRFDDAKAKYESGGSPDEIMQIFSPEADAEEPASDTETSSDVAGTTKKDSETQETDTWVSPFEASQKPESRIAAARADYEAKVKELNKKKGLTPSERSAAIKKLDDAYNKYVEQVKAGKSDSDIEAEEEASNKAIRDKIPTKRKGKPIVGATHILKSTRGTGANITKMPKALAQKVKLPDGFEIDSDVNGNPLWIEGKYGFARNPKTGMYGKIKPDGKFVLSIDPTNPNFVEGGKDSPEAIKAYNEWMANDKEADPKKDDELRKKYNLISRGVPTNDVAPDNKTIVENAIMEAIAMVGIGE